jgi:acetoin utilization protein AcuC
MSHDPLQALEEQLAMAMQPLLIGSDIYRTSSYGDGHPLSIPRVSTTIDLVRATGWLAPGAYIESPVATPEDLIRFHDPEYVAAVMEAEREQHLDAARRERFCLGRAGNPIFPEVFCRPATAVGASLLAADLLGAGGVIYNPAGGTHHGRPDRASGFCYFNDAALAILRLLDRGMRRVYYLDVDAHHGDGVEAAFAGDDRVLTVSVHEDGRWPFSGTVRDRAGGSSRNIPVLPGFNDSEMDFVREEALIPLGRAHDPEIVVIQCGADALADDPLSRLALSNGALWRVVRDVARLAPRVLVLGGGGYNPWSVARCWAGVWATLNGISPPVDAPDPARAILQALSWRRSQGRCPPEAWLSTIADPPRSGPVRDPVKRVVEAVLRS